MHLAETPTTIPTDAALRARLWREWIQLDVPQGERPRPRVVERPVQESGDWLEQMLEPAGRPRGIVSGLASAVRESLVDGELPGGDRERILRRAQSLGLNRFEALLLIATVQHRAEPSRSRFARPVVHATSTIERRAGWSVGKLLGCIVAVEAAIAAVAWVLLRG